MSCAYILKKLLNEVIIIIIIVHSKYYDGQSDCMG